MVAQINLPTNRFKAQLIDRLNNMVPRLDLAIIDRHIGSLVKSSKIQQESATNPKLREAMKQLENSLNSR